MRIKKKGLYSLSEDQKKRMQDKLDIKSDKSSGCWIYKGYTSRCGYILMTFDGHYIKVHRASYMAYKGDIPKNLQICHTCDNRKCVNPDHLWLGTAKDNAQDRNNKGRNADFLGSKNGAAKLTEQKVLEIKKLLKEGKSLPHIANIFNVSKSNIWCIKKGLRWSHVYLST